METRIMDKSSSALAGFTVIASYIVGIAAFLVAILAVFNWDDFVGAGVCFIAAALAFGLIANAIYRD
jgi:hypothetical protein